jgi:signal transduction histidine kinase
MKTMNGTIHSTSGFPHVTGNGPGPTAKLRVAGLALTALLGFILVIWVSRSTWERLDHLQREFAGLKADSFYMGVRMRNDIERLNDTLLRYRLRGDTNDAEAFRSGSRDFKQRLERDRAKAATPLEFDFFQQVGTAYDDYLIESAKGLEASRAWWSSKAKDFQVSYEQVQKQSERLLALCDKFIDDQRLDFDAFLKASNHTLANFKQLLQISAVLLLALAAALLLFIYRGMIAPLRLRLTESQAIIVRQEKLASLGVLAAGVAHEIRNPLTAIKFRLFSLKKSLAAAAQEDAGVIADEISRLERIVKDFLEFARPSDPELVALPAQRIMQEVRDLLRPQLEKSAITLKLEASEPVWVRADTQQIKQVLINLIQNSADSIGHDGVITLRVYGQPGPRKGPDAAVVLEVADTGKGIPSEVQKRLFDPFFTTKAGGTGLGLPIAARIVEKHGGKLHYQTAHNRGTTFRVVLPEAGKHET